MMGRFQTDLGLPESQDVNAPSVHGFTIVRSKIFSKLSLKINKKMYVTATDQHAKNMSTNEPTIYLFHNFHFCSTILESDIG